MSYAPEDGVALVSVLPSKSARMVMKSVRTEIVFCLCAAWACGAASKGAEITIGLIGDSTVASTYGWGPALADRLGDSVTVVNSAVNGATLDSLSSRLDRLLERDPHYVLIQFGHNDMKRYGAEEYRRKLNDYVRRVSRSGSKPVVLSSVTRRVFDKNGRISPRVINGDRSLPVFAGVAGDVARANNIPFIDLNAITIAHHNRIGPEASAEYNFEGTDRTHFSKAGAAAIAELILAELVTVIPELSGSVK